MKYFEIFNYIVTTMQERFQQIGYPIQLETHLIMIVVNDGTFTEMVIYME